MTKNLLGSAFLALLHVAAVVPAAAESALRLGDPLRADPAMTAPPATTLSFTPRSSGVFDLETARLSLSLAPFEDRASHASTRDAHVSDGQRFAVGGALDFGSVEIGGGLVREEHGAFARQGVDARIGVGGLTTRMGYVEDTGPAGEGARYVLGADLDAMPGLSVGAGLSLDSEPSAAETRDAEGVVRFRLSF